MPETFDHCPSPMQRILASAGAVLAAASVALAAYASHAAVTGDARERLWLAAVFAFGHGLALAALAPGASRRLGRWALAGLLLGVLLFSGSLAGSQVLGLTTQLAPLGGSLLILSWLVWAVATWTAGTGRR